MKKKTPSLNIKQADDLNLIGRVLTFANADTFKSQDEVYGIFRDHPYVLRVDGKPYIAPIPESEGVGPFLNDQWQIKRALSIIASGTDKTINESLNEVQNKLREKLHGVAVDLGLRRGELSLHFHPLLDGMEVILWYGVALIFENDIIHLLRRCQFEQNREPCGKFFLYTPKQRKYCAEHAVEGKKQAVLRAIKNWQAEHPRMRSRKQPKRTQQKKEKKK